MGHSVHVSSEDARFSRQLDARQWEARHPGDASGRAVHRRWPWWALWLLGVLLGICCAAFSYAYAAEVGAGVQAPRYKSGGIGQADVELMKRDSTRFSTTLTFASRQGEYLADVAVKIRDVRQNVVLEVVSEGPILLVDLPPGWYTVEASSQGRSVTRKVSVPTGGHVRAVLSL